MLNKILVALDGSPISAIVFEQALAIAKATQAQLMLLHIFFDDEEGHPLIDPFRGLATLNAQSYAQLQQQWKTYELEWQTRLQSYVEQAETAGVKAELTQSYGNPGRVICDWAWTWDANLIVLGRRGQNRKLGWNLGSVSSYVSQHATCSVMLVDDPQISPSAKTAVSQMLSAR